jgi:hypothetical protein
MWRGEKGERKGGNAEYTPGPTIPSDGHCVTIASINGKQMKRLQTLWGLFCRHRMATALAENSKDCSSRMSWVDAKDREARLGWVAGTIGRQIGSCSELTAAEAKTAIDAIQKHLPAELLTKRRPSRETARAYGTAGRKGLGDKEVRMADAGTLQLLAKLMTALGWTRERLDAFLRSRKSPVKSGTIRTLAEANRVIWILKGMLRREKSAQAGMPVPQGPDANNLSAPVSTADEMGAG